MSQNPERILIIKLSALGDIVQSLPVLQAIKDTWPNCKVDWICGEVGKGLLEDHPFLDRVIVYPRAEFGRLARMPIRWPLLLKKLADLRKDLVSVSYDMAIDLQGLLKSGLINFLSEAKVKAGFDRSREFSYIFLNKKVPPYDPDKHAVLRYLDLVRALGASSKEIRFPVHVTEDHFQNAQKLLDRYQINQDNFAILIPGTIWPTKRWLTSSFAELAKLIQKDTDLHSLVVGGAQDNALGREIALLSNGAAKDLTGTTDLKTLSALFKMSRFGVSTDTGPMHLAAACGLRLVALFGPTAPWRTGPFGNGHIVIRKEMACSPCFKRSCSHNSCMKSIGVEEVFDAVKRLF